MLIDVVTPRLQTLFFAAIFLGALLLSARAAKRTEVFPLSLTKELKGFAILAVVFGHIGFALSKDNTFLQPLSIMAGVGVNLFLFLSGFGLTVSYEKTNPSPAEFYRRRFRPILVPLWITLTVLYVADFFLLKTAYPMASVIESYFGFFPSAKMLTDLNSPLWYVTFLFSYYLAFPFLYRKTRPFVSVFLVLLYSIAFIIAMRPFVGDTIWLYVIHCNAFPLGMLAVQLAKRLPKRSVKDLLPLPVRAFAALALAAVIAYTAVHSGVGRWYEQPVSMITMLAVVVLFALVPIRLALLNLFGTYSYEIYLFHWPLLYRYDVLYKNFPPYVATALYLAVFLGLGWMLLRISGVHGRREKGVG